MGSALMGSLQIVCFLTEGLFGYSVKLCRDRCAASTADSIQRPQSDRSTMHVPCSRQMIAYRYHIYIYIDTHTYIHTYLPTYVRTYVSTYVHKNTYTHIHAHTRTYTLIHAHTRTYTHNTHIHTLLKAFLPLRSDRKGWYGLAF